MDGVFRRLLSCRASPGLSQLDVEMAVECSGYLGQGADGGVLPGPFQFRDLLLTHSGPLRELALRGMLPGMRKSSW